MRHNKAHRKLGRTSEHRKALFRNQLSSLVEHGRIRTTLAKAKELRRMADRLVTQGKKGTVAARRRARRWLPDQELIAKLFDDIAPRFQERNGGYTRVLKLGPRDKDSAEMAIVEWVEFEVSGEKSAPSSEEE